MNCSMILHEQIKWNNPLPISAHMVFAIACLTTNQLTSVHEFGLHTRACEIKS